MNKLCKLSDILREKFWFARLNVTFESLMAEWLTCLICVQAAWVQVPLSVTVIDSCCLPFTRSQITEAPITSGVENVWMEEWLLHMINLLLLKDAKWAVANLSGKIWIQSPVQDAQMLTAHQIERACHSNTSWWLMVFLITGALRNLASILCRCLNGRSKWTKPDI